MHKSRNSTCWSPATKYRLAHLLPSFQDHPLEHLHELIVLLEVLRGVGTVDVDEEDISHRHTTISLQCKLHWKLQEQWAILWNPITLQNLTHTQAILVQEGFVPSGSLTTPKRPRWVFMGNDTEEVSWIPRVTGVMEMGLGAAMAPSGLKQGSVFPSRGACSASGGNAGGCRDATGSNQWKIWTMQNAGRVNLFTICVALEEVYLCLCSLRTVCNVPKRHAG